MKKKLQLQLNSHYGCQPIVLLPELLVIPWRGEAVEHLGTPIYKYFSRSGANGEAIYRVSQDVSSRICVPGMYRTDVARSEDFIAKGEKLFGDWDLYIPVSKNDVGGVDKNQPFACVAKMGDTDLVITGSIFKLPELPEVLLAIERGEWPSCKTVEKIFWCRDAGGWYQKKVLILWHKLDEMRLPFSLFNIAPSVPKVPSLHCLGPLGWEAFRAQSIDMEYDPENNTFFYRDCGGCVVLESITTPEQLFNFAGELPTGWVGDGSGFFWKTTRGGISAVQFLRRPEEFSAHAEEVGEWVDFHEKRSALHLHYCLDEWKKSMRAKCLEKARKEFDTFLTASAIQPRRNSRRRIS